jgi:hypothetical protein
MKKISFLIIILLLFSSGCATLLTGTKDTISFNSTPQGAAVYKDGIELCTTPCRMPVKRSINSSEIEFKLDGYESRYFTLDKEMNFVSVLNLGNLFGWAVDAATGSIVKYSRKSYDLTMKSGSLPTSSILTEIHINTRMNLVGIYAVQN